MAEKKRKGAASAPVTAPPAKKSRKLAASEPTPATELKVNEVAPTPSTTNNVVAKSKSSRKRAADFLDEEGQSAELSELTATQTSATKSKSNAAGKAKPLSKGNVATLNTKSANSRSVSNGPSSTVVETQSVDQAPTETEQDDSEDEDQGAALLAGFDSDTEDPAEDQGDMSRPQPIPQYKKTSKKLKQAKEQGSDGPGTVYVGRIPHGFYEAQMREYFTQFGTITKLRLSRNKRTGASKHFAFIEFESDEVAKIVADTMDNYLMFGHILKCKYAPSDNLHPDVWKGANKKYRKIPHDKLQRQQLEAPKTQEQWAKKNEKERSKRQKQAEKMKAIGYEYVVPELRDPAEAIKQQQIHEAHGIPPAALTDHNEPDAIEAAPEAPSVEVATKKAKKSKGKTSSAREELTVGNLDAQNAGQATEVAKVQEDEEAKASGIATHDTNHKIPSAPPTKKTPKLKKSGSSMVNGSNHGDYDNLSSIPVGAEAAPSHVTDAYLPHAQKEGDQEQESIFTHAGVADAVLAGRKSDRKKTKSNQSSKSGKAGKSAAKQAEAEVSELAPEAVNGNKEEKKSKLKGILKKDKRAA